MAEILRVVARLLQRSQDERRERLAPTPRLLGVLRDELRRLARERRRLLRRQPLRHGRRRHAEIGELREQVLDRLRVRTLVDAVQRLAPPPGEERADVLVREDHQLLDEHVRVRLALEPGVGDTSVAVEPKHLLRRLHLQRAPGEPAVAQHRRELVVQRQLVEHLRRSLAALGLAVGEPGVGADHRAVELAARRTAATRP